MTARRAPRWGDWLVRRSYRPDPDPSDPGAEAVGAWLGDRIDGAAILDVGIGMGRTTGLLQDRAGRYVGVDVDPAMVLGAHRAYPDALMARADVRDLSRVAADGEFDIAVFSLNGIDVLGPEDRPRGLAELARVVRPGGWVVLSSHALPAGGSPQEPGLAPILTPGNGLRLRSRVRLLAELPGTRRRFRSHPADLPSGDGWAMRPMASHGFRFVIQLATIGRTVEQLRAAGLQVRGMWTNEGEELALDATATTAAYVHYACEKVA